MPRPHVVYDFEDGARSMAQTFLDREPKRLMTLPFTWPARLQNVGDSLAVAYTSDKWTGRPVDYKHLAESRNRALLAPGLLRDFCDPKAPWGVVGPMISFETVPMPAHYARLARVEEIDLQLYADTDERGRCYFGDNRDAGVTKVTIAHAWLGGAMMLWSEQEPAREDQPFLFVYTQKHGVLAIIVGEELNVEKEGIVG